MKESTQAALPQRRLAEARKVIDKLENDIFDFACKAFAWRGMAVPRLATECEGGAGVPPRFLLYLII